MLNDARIAKGVALFATLIGIYNWIGQGTSLFDILVLTFAAALILSVDSSEREIPALPIDRGEIQNKKEFFHQVSIPLRQSLLAWREHVFCKNPNLNPFYLFSFE